MRKYLALVLTAAALAACDGPGGNHRPHSALFIGIDVSGSFYNSKTYNDGLDFISHYIYARLNGLGQLQIPKEVFVSTIGGNSAKEQQVKAFHPIEDFKGRTPEQIKADLQTWFAKSDRITDFNAFFHEVASIGQKRNLSLMPITVVLLSDGIPAIPGDEMSVGDFTKIDVSPLEYLSRNVTLRLLYGSPMACDKWENAIPHNRVRMWTVADQVMVGWRNQLKDGQPMEQQAALWDWVANNVDFKVRGGGMRLMPKKKS